MTNLPTTTTRMTGGETPRREDTLALRQLINEEPDVFYILDLTPIKGGRWAYLIETPFTTFPRYVFGTTDEKNETPIILATAGSKYVIASTFRELIAKMS